MALKFKDRPILTDTDLAYLGGLFDGEGSAGMYTYNQTRPAGRKAVRKATMQLTMTDPEPVRFMALCFPGSYQGKHQTPYGKQHGYKHTYRWTCSARNARLVATTLLPFVKNLAKVKQLETVLGV